MYQQNIVIVLISIVFLTHWTFTHFDSIISQKSQSLACCCFFFLLNSVSISDAENRVSTMRHFYLSTEKKIFSEQLQFLRSTNCHACNNALNCWHSFHSRSLSLSTHTHTLFFFTFASAICLVAVAIWLCFVADFESAILFLPRISNRM